MWAAAQPRILALALVGSHARGTAAETSDIDLILISVDPDSYLKDTKWIQQYGTVEKVQVEDYGLVTSIRVWYANGLEVEFGITDDWWSKLPLDKGTRQVMADGTRVLFEKGSILSRLQLSL